MENNKKTKTKESDRGITIRIFNDYWMEILRKTKTNLKYTKNNDKLI